MIWKLNHVNVVEHRYLGMYTVCYPKYEVYVSPNLEKINEVLNDSDFPYRNCEIVIFSLN